MLCYGYFVPFVSAEKVYPFYRYIVLTVYKKLLTKHDNRER